MKKLLSIVLTLSLVFSLGVTALAGDKSGKDSKDDKGKGAKTEAVSEPSKPEKQPEKQPDSASQDHSDREPDHKHDAAKPDTDNTPSTEPDEDNTPSTEPEGDNETAAAPEESVKSAVREAEETALADAGFERDAVKSLHAYKLYTRGEAYAYRVEFAVYDSASRQTTVYAYEISLEDGAIANANSWVH